MQKKKRPDRKQNKPREANIYKVIRVLQKKKALGERVNMNAKQKRKGRKATVVECQQGKCRRSLKAIRVTLTLQPF